MNNRGGKKMKKSTATAAAIIFVLFSFISCEKGLLGPSAGAAQAEEMLRLLPQDVAAVFFIDVQRILTVEAMDKLINQEMEDEEFEEFTDYEKFVAMTGIDLKKDVYYVAAAMKERNGIEEEPDWGVGIVNLKYDKEALLSFIKAKTEETGSELTEEEYNGYTLYNYKEKDEEGTFAFIDKSNIAAGNEPLVKSVIDVLKKKKGNVLQSEEFSALFKDTDKSALFWGGVLIPPEATAALSDEIPMPTNLESIQAVSLSFDYKNKTIMAEIKLRSSDPISNQEIADNLIGLKEMGSMITIQDFNFVEVLERIEITSAPDHVRIYASYPDDFFNDFMSKFTLKETEEEDIK
jgi:hypothetical protein